MRVESQPQTCVAVSASSVAGDLVAGRPQANLAAIARADKSAASHVIDRVEAFASTGTGDINEAPE